MLIIMKVGLSGPTINLSPGDTANFEDEEAQRIIDAGFAVAADEQPAMKRGRKGKADVVSSEGDAGADNGSSDA